jgi:hypothetical protein
MVERQTSEFVQESEMMKPDRVPTMYVWVNGEDDDRGEDE